MGSGSDYSILSILQQRPVVGDGSYVFTLEKRGYVTAGAYTPEAVVEHPDAVLSLHREFLRAGADVLQAFTYSANDGKLHAAGTDREFTCEQINQAACDLLHQLKSEGHQFLMCGGISFTPTFTNGGSHEDVKKEFRKQTEIFVKNKMDFLLGEFFEDVEEAELAIAAMKETGLPAGCTMRVGPRGDAQGVPPGECAVRMARAGADLVGVNCQFDPFTTVDTMRSMKAALDTAGLSAILMMQPLGFHAKDADNLQWGYHDLPEFPFALEPRLLTRWDVRKIVRDAYDAGVRYFGGCCGFESYHIREIAYELEKERGFLMPGKDKSGPWGSTLDLTVYGPLKRRVGKDYWTTTKPGTGRPLHVDSVAQ